MLSIYIYIYYVGHIEFMRLLEFGLRVGNDEGLWPANLGSEIGFRGSGFNERFGLGLIKYPGSSCEAYTS